MIQQKSNLKKLSYITLSLITVIFIVAGYDRSENIYQQYARENENYSNLIANSAENYFRKVDMILDLIGNHLVTGDNYKNTEAAKDVFSRMLGLNSSIIAYALISPEGKYLLTHLDIPPEKIPSVLTREAARDSFLQTLQTESLVIGRTYFLNKTQKMAIPVRKAFYDENGEPIAVMAVAIDVENSEMFDTSLLQSGSKIIHLLRDIDQHRQLYLHDAMLDDNATIYETPISPSAYRKALSLISENSDMDIERFKQSNQSTSFRFTNQVDQVEYLVSVRYIETLGLWANSYVKASEIRNAIFIDVAKLIALYLVMAAVLLTLFRKIEETENQKRKELEFTAHHDSLTGLNNRNFLIQNAQRIIDHYKSFYFLLIDIDGLKLVNDIHGHAFGDDFLRIFAERLATLASKRGEAIRLSGDEFLFITDLGFNPAQTVEAFKQELEAPISVNDIQINFTISLGIARYPMDGKRLSKLISSADMALHEAKQSEKGLVVFFDKAIEEGFRRRALIEKSIPQAIRQNQFSLVYQPQIRYPDTLYGVEALIRWHSPELGFVSPVEFIPVAESSGLMPQLGETIIEKACEEISRVKKKTQCRFQLSLNISAKQFLHPDFSQHLMATIERYKLTPKEITLELTESIFVHDMATLISKLDQLKAVGFKISMDDFGTGFSSLSMLRKIPLNEIKIDKSFVDDITTERSAEYVAKTIILIGKQLEYEVVLAEGAETVEQVALLVEQGCNTFQGYYFSKPLPVEQLESYIETIRCHAEQDLI